MVTNPDARGFVDAEEGKKIAKFQECCRIRGCSRDDKECLAGCEKEAGLSE